MAFDLDRKCVLIGATLRNNALFNRCLVGIYTVFLLTKA